MSVHRVALLLICSSTISACDGTEGDETNPVFTLQVISGDRQTSLQGSELPEPIIFKVIDQFGRPQSAVELRTLVTKGGGSLSPPVSATGIDGTVQLEWTLGDDFVQEAKVWTRDQLDASVNLEATATFRYESPEEITDGWPVGTLDLESQKTQRIFDGIDEIRKGTYPEVHSLLLVQTGKLLLEAYWPGHDSNGQLVQWDLNTPHEVQSASKSFRSMLIGIAIDKGFIESVTTPVVEFFPEYAHLMDGKEAITLEHVLTMSTGLEWIENQVPFSDATNTLSTMYAMPFTKWTEYVLSRPLIHEPGTVWLYNTGASIMLNRIVMSAIDASLFEFVRNSYANLVESASLPGVGNPLGAVTLPRDLAKFGQVYLDDGKWKGTQIVSSGWIEESFEPRFTTGSGNGYGYQWWSRTLKTVRNLYPTHYAAGNGGQFVFVIRKLDLVVVSTGGNFGLSTMGQMIPFLETWILPAFE